MLDLLLAVLKSLEHENIHYCMLRDADQLDQFSSGGEIDLLVKESQIPQICKLLTRLKFINLPNRGYYPHHFFIAFDENTGSWLKLDLVGEMVYGKPIPYVKTDLASNCLAHRHHFDSTFIPAPEDELVTLLLHCVLDKGSFSHNRCERLKFLSRQITNDKYLSTLLVTYWLPYMPWSQLATLIEAENLTAILSYRKEVLARLIDRDRLGALKRQARERTLRKITGWVGAHRPPSLSIALLAPDGAGKSTLAERLKNNFYFPVCTIYMGLYSKQYNQSRLSQLPGFSFLQRLLRMWKNYFLARYQLMRRKLVVYDRYPYDSLLNPHQNEHLLKRFRHWLLTHPSPAPDLVFLLDAPGETLYARKKEHSPAFLEEQRQSYQRLMTQLPHAYIVDATCDAGWVYQQVTSIIWNGYLHKQSN